MKYHYLDLIDYTRTCARHIKCTPTRSMRLHVNNACLQSGQVRPSCCECVAKSACLLAQTEMERASRLAPPGLEANPASFPQLLHADQIGTDISFETHENPRKLSKTYPQDRLFTACPPHFHVRSFTCLDGRIKVNPMVRVSGDVNQ